MTKTNVFDIAVKFIRIENQLIFSTIVKVITSQQIFVLKKNNSIKIIIEKQLVIHKNIKSYKC